MNAPNVYQHTLPLGVFFRSLLLERQRKKTHTTIVIVKNRSTFHVPNLKRLVEIYL